MVAADVLGFVTAQFVGGPAARLQMAGEGDVCARCGCGQVSEPDGEVASGGRIPAPGLIAGTAGIRLVLVAAAMLMAGSVSLLPHHDTPLSK